MATPTSYSNRSKRKSSKPVTADKGRTNRARVSTAKTTSSDTRSSNSGARVTNASQRTSTGSTKVSSSTRPALPARSSATDLQRLQTAARTKPTRPAPKVNIKPPAKPALPPGQKGGQLVSTGTRQSRAQAKANAAAQGTTGTNRVGRSDARPALPPGKPGGALTRASAGGALARTGSGSSSAALRGAAKAGRGLLGKVLTPLAGAQEVQDMLSRDRRWNDYKERNYGNTRVKPKQGDAQSRFAGARDANLNRINNDPRFAAPKEKPKPPAPRPAGTQPSQPAARPAASRPSQTSPSRPTTTKPAARNIGPVADGDAFAREKDPKKFNPLMQKTFDYQKGDAPDQRAARNKTEGKGPVADGKAYAESLKINKKDKKRPKRRNEY